jgi:hypothetical protein
MVYKDQVPSCIQWCKAARDCLGPDLYDQIVGKLKDRDDNKEKQENSGGGVNDTEENN